MKEKRIGLGLTMKQVATQAGISEGMYCLIESGRRNPSVKVAKALSLILGMEWTDFFNNVKAKQVVNL